MGNKRFLYIEPLVTTACNGLPYVSAALFGEESWRHRVRFCRCWIRGSRKASFPSDKVDYRGGVCLTCRCSVDTILIANDQAAHLRRGTRVGNSNLNLSF